MGTTIDRESVVYIVTASNHYWGASNSLYEAIKNANLGEPKSPAEWFADELEYNFNIKEAVKAWGEWGEADCKVQNDDDTHTVVIHRWDPALWEDYNVNPITGAVNFISKENVDFDAQEEIKKATIIAEYTDGVFSLKK